MTRGLGTALDLALTGVVLAVAGAGAHTAIAATRGFEDAGLFLAAVALLADVISAIGNGLA